MRLSHIQLVLSGLAGSLLLTSVASAQCPAADIYEPNDDCLNASLLTAGSYSGLTLFGPVNAGGENQDFFAVDVPAGDEITVDLTFLTATGDIDVYLYDNTSPNCGGTAAGDYLIRGFTGSDNESIAWTNTSGGVVTYTVMVDAWDSDTGFDCNDYSMNISIATPPPDPCVVGPDDSFEENDDCATAPMMIDGTYPGLFVSKTDMDYYEVQVADGDTLTVDILFSDALGDLDLELYLDQADCVADNPEIGSYGVADNESVSYTNISGGSLTMVVHVYHYQFDAAAECNSYDLVITGSGGSIGTPICAGDGSVAPCPCGNESALGSGEGCMHSGGVGATISVSGSASVAADDIAFTIDQAIPGQPSLLLQGSTLINVAFKDGLLCMGNPTERVEVMFLDPSGSATTVGSIVTEGAVSAGDTRHYQIWYRNPGGVSPCGTGSNFSSGLTVVYLP